MGIAPIDQLGQALDADWSAHNNDPHLFSELAVRRLTAAGLHRELRPADILAWAMKGELPEQFDKASAFGQPPITMFRARRFVIDALFWLDGTTNIHDHAFAGAFQVLAGSSIETTFRFEASRAVDGHMYFGKLDLLETALRRTGEVRPITIGPSYIHGLFHLERPSVTVLIRALQPPMVPVQLQYEPCGVAWNPFFRDAALDRMVEIVGLLDKSNDRAFDDLVGGLVARSDLYTAHRVIRAGVGFKDQRRADALLDLIQDREASETFSAWLARERVEHFLRQRRGLVHEPELRFLLAVLLNSHRGEHSLKLVSAFAGADKDPAAQVASWLARLSNVKMRLQVDGAPWEPNVLNLPDFEPGHEGALADALAGRARDFTPSERIFLERLRALPHLTALFSA
jgi:hypothetical protein